jgi:hypothetical protein
MLPDERFGSARFVGGYWTRDGRVEVDLVGGTDPERTEAVELVGSITWRTRQPFALYPHLAGWPGGAVPARSARPFTDERGILRDFTPAVREIAKNPGRVSMTRTVVARASPVVVETDRRASAA